MLCPLSYGGVINFQFLKTALSKVYDALSLDKTQVFAYGILVANMAAIAQW